jgi:hypothetical protein
MPPDVPPSNVCSRIGSVAWQTSPGEGTAQQRGREVVEQPWWALESQLLSQEIRRLSWRQSEDSTELPRQPAA